MIPLQLTLEGLYSYQKRQVIDFQNLTKAGLFGIFGQVGSGKSSILEAISYALYGETERLNAKDKRAYNMMNLKSNRAYLEFDFISADNKKFRVTRELKRNSKRFDDVKVQSVVFYEEINGHWVPLDHVNAEKLIGLSYANFKRTIIIPQGQFREFLELGASDRTRMMKEIFNLHQYDLYDKSTSLGKKNQSELDVLQGKLSGFEEVSEEIIQVLKEQHHQENKEFAAVQKQYNEANETFQRLKTLKSDFENLNHKKNDFEKLQSEKLDNDQKREKLELYERIYKAFHPLLSDEDRLQQEGATKTKDRQLQSEKLNNLTQQVQKTENEIEKLRPDFEKLSGKKQEENDLELIVQILGFQKEIATLKARTLKGKQEVENVSATVLVLEEDIKKREMEVEQASQNRIDATLLMEVGNWFARQKSLAEMLEIQQKKVAFQTQKRDEIAKKLEVLKISEDTFENSFSQQNLALETEKKQWEHKCSQLEVQQKLAHYAHSLHEGEKCPLCGSLEHPEIAATEDVSANLQNARTEISRVEAHQNELMTKYNDAKNLISQKSIFENQRQEELRQYQHLESQLETHQNSFVWETFCSDQPQEFEARKAASLQIDQEIAANSKLIAEKRAELEKQRKNLNGYQQHLQRFNIEETQKQTQILQNQTMLKVLKSEAYEHESEEKVRQDFLSLKEKNRSLEESFNLLTQQINELNPQLAAQKTNVNLLDEQLDVLKLEIEKNQDKITETLSGQQIESVEKVREILALPLDVPALRKEIEQFIIAFETLRNGISELEKKLKEVSFDEHLYEAEQEKLQEVTAALHLATEKVTKTNAEIQRLSQAFEAKKDLVKHQSDLQKRAQNLQVLNNLFKGAGFVQYVSSIYLRQLCDSANVRFHRMTRNQLSLQLNENNDFEIIDYLNEGKSRSVKTLSGGQAFQVSLSLALALAESVQSHAKADKNFFFIDEGFGTQDQESVNIVFETLSNLQKEHRIVGIISHVEELKERMPVSLNIVKDEEKGSLIEMM